MGLSPEGLENNGSKNQLPRVIRSILDPMHYVVEEPSPGAVRLDFGVTPFGPPPEIYSIIEELYLSGELIKALLTYNIDASPAINFVRERFGIGTTPYIAFSSGGSDEIAERLLTQLIDIRSESGLTKVIGPIHQYPHVLNFIERHTLFDKTGKKTREQRIRYETFQTDVSIYTPYDQVIRRMVSVFYNDPRENIIFYITNPNTPTGDLASFEAINDLAWMCSQKKQHLLIVDEAFGDAVEDKYSAIPLTEKYPNLVVIRSLSKSIGLPGLRKGYIVASKEVGEQYQKVRRDCDLSGIPQLIANRILEPGILARHLGRTREETVRVKSEVLQEFSDRGIKFFFTDRRSPILLIDGGYPGFYEEVKRQQLEVTSGFEPYRYTIPDDMSQLEYEVGQKGRCVRMVIPRDIEDIPNIAKRLRMAMDAR